MDKITQMYFPDNIGEIIQEIFASLELNQFSNTGCRERMASARRFFFYKVIESACARWLPGVAHEGLRNQIVASIAPIDDSLSDQYLDAIVTRLPDYLLDNPPMLGWLYQMWNQPIRDHNSWAISLKDEKKHECAQWISLTQVFTDDYIADFIACRGVHLLSKKGCGSTGHLSICDPAVGTGHLLLAAINALHTAGVTANSIAAMLFGFDIDAEAVAIARVAVLLQLIKCGADRDLNSLWNGLQRSILVLESPLGSLDRNDSKISGRKFDLVLANPPFLGRRKLSISMRQFLDRNFPGAHIDLCAAFMQRCIELTAEHGALGFITTDRWLRLKGYADLRSGIGDFKGVLGELSLDCVCELGAQAFNSIAALHDGVRVAIMCAIKTPPSLGHNFSYFNFSATKSYSGKVEAVRRIIDQNNFETLAKHVPQESWASGNIARVFLSASGLPTTFLSSLRIVKDKADVVVGTQTNDDNRFVRYAWEVPAHTPGWQIHSKGGGYARWSGLQRWVINWGEGRNFFFTSDVSRARAEKWIEREGWCYSWFANGCLGLREKQRNWSFGRAAAAGVFSADERVAGFLNSRVASLCTRAIGAKIQLPEGIVRQIPLPVNYESIPGYLVRLAVQLKRAIIRTKPTEGLFDPSRRLSFSEILVVEALLLVCEGLIEAHVERSLPMACSQSAELSGLYGPMVAWFVPQVDIDNHPIWHRIPPEFKEIKSQLLSNYTEFPYFDSRDSGIISKNRISAALRGELKDNQFQWLLPSSGAIERLCRILKAHPFDVALICCELTDRTSEIGREITRPYKLDSVLIDILEQLGHSWWAIDKVCERPLRELSVESVCDISMRYLSDELNQKRDRDARLSWLLNEFIPWQNKVFLQRSPIQLRVDSHGKRRFFHAWSRPFVPIDC